MPIKFNLKKYINPIFIESGTYKGDGVYAAIRAGFKKIYSIEIDYERYLECKKKFEKINNVEIIHGDSGKVLPILLKNLNETITFWIDAHYCADGAYIGEKWCPMKEEFEAIKNHHIENHTLLIDDWRCMDNTHIDYTWKNQVNNNNINCKTITNNGGKEVGFLGKEKCYETLKNINNKYNFSFENGVEENDVLVCQIIKINIPRLKKDFNDKEELLISYCENKKNHILKATLTQQQKVFYITEIKKYFKQEYNKLKEELDKNILQEENLNDKSIL